MGVPAIGDRLWSPALRAWVQVLEAKQLFGRDVVKVLVEGSNQIKSVAATSLESARSFDLGDALSVTAGARIWSALGSDLFLAPLVSKVLPLPHQFRVIRKAMSGFPIRMMLADEVGMGKTIEAGLILKELKLRGMIERVLVLAPKSLLLQWIAEMETLFGERFDLVLPGNWGADVASRGDNEWKRYKQVVSSIDSVKPRESQRGWTQERIDRFNLERFHDLVGAGWDLVIIDESHKIAGASEEVARHELAQEMSKASPHLLLLTATPHSGKSDAFGRLLSLLDPVALQVGTPLNRELVEPHVIRTEKRTATDADGKPLFASRSTRLVSVPFEVRHALQQQLYEEVSTYVIEGYNKALRTGDKGSRLLLILIQRLVSSSTRAIRRFLERRLEVLKNDEATVRALTSPDLPEDVDLNDVAQAALFFVESTSSEQEDVQRLLDLSIQVENAGSDARTEALYEHMLRIAQEDSEPSKKFLVFTEFTATQEMLREFLELRGYPVATLNGSMDLSERREAVEEFCTEKQVLISTDAGGEGLNMQFANVVFNYDLPWNPMRVEQRIGRVDRIGQKQEVRALNLVLENSVEERVYEVWQQKLATILAEFGVDKTGDVLDSGEASAEFERLARTALLNPKALDNEFDQVVTDIRRIAKEGQQTRSLYTGKLADGDKIPTVPLRAWLDTLRGSRQRTLIDEVSAQELSELVIEQINSLRPYFCNGKPVPHLDLGDLGFAVEGWFSVWKVGIADGAWRQQHVFASFCTPDGKTYAKSAQRIWDALATRQVTTKLLEELEHYDYDLVQRTAETEAAELYETVVSKSRERARRRLNALDMSYLARRTALANIGLDTVREARRRDLEREYRERRADIAGAAESLPELDCLFLAKVAAS
jgi:superfamily II DNA or RNA helicase